MGWFSCTTARALQLLTLFCLVSSGRLIRGIQVELSYKPINVMNLTCLDPSPDGDATFSYMQIVQFTAQGKITVWATLKDGRATHSPDFLEVMGKRIFNITGDVRENIHRLEIVVYEYALDLGMGIYEEFTCSVGYDGQEKRTISPMMINFPEVSLQAEKAKFMLRTSRAVDVICWATLPTLAGTLEFTMKIVRMSDKTLVASWRRNEIPTCPPAPNAMYSNLSVINEVVCAKARLMEESDLGKDFKCNVETKERESTKSSDDCLVYVVVLLIGFICIVFLVILFVKMKITFNWRILCRPIRCMLGIFMFQQPTER